MSEVKSLLKNVVEKDQLKELKETLLRFTSKTEEGTNQLTRKLTLLKDDMQTRTQ
jgi:hypothetical protein